MSLWTECSDPDHSAITFAEWGQRIISVLAGPDDKERSRAIEAVAELTRRLDAMWSDGGGAYAFAPQVDLSIAEDEWVIDD